MSPGKNALTFPDRQAWRSWLDVHGAEAAEAWLVIQKQHSDQPGLSLAAAVEEALCYGWIDSTLNTRDDQTYLLRFSPRKPDSVWSLANIRRIGELMAQGLLQEPGAAAVRAAKASGQWQAALERENLDDIPAELEAALKRRKGAIQAYRELPDSRKKRYIYWIQSAKRVETRQKRIAEIVREVIGARF